MSNWSAKCFYIYEYRDPATGKPLYVGKGSSIRAWDHLKGILSGEERYTPSRFKRYLSDALLNGTSPEDLAPHIISWYEHEDESYSAEIERIAEIGLKNLLSGNTGRNQGLPHHRRSCDPQTCPIHPARLSANTDKRIVGHFALWEVRGPWTSYPAAISQRRFASLCEEAREDECRTRGHALAWATWRISQALQPGYYDIQKAGEAGGFICRLIDTACVVLEAHNGRLLQYHRVSASVRTAGEVLHACRQNRPSFGRSRDAFLAELASKAESLTA
ncbi:MAG: hypothetical protein ABW003_00495 [Microvirga sp.]